MEKTYIIIKILLLIVIFGGMFYWFELRPTEIRKNCAEAIKRGSSNDLKKDFGNFLTTRNDTYLQCVRLKGL